MLAISPFRSAPVEMTTSFIHKDLFNECDYHVDTVTDRSSGKISQT